MRLGDTTVVCGVKAEIAEPELDSPQDGFFGVFINKLCSVVGLTDLSVPNVDLPAICSPKFRPGPPSDEAQVLSDRLNDILIS